MGGGQVCTSPPPSPSPSRGQANQARTRTAGSRSSPWVIARGAGRDASAGPRPGSTSTSQTRASAPLALQPGPTKPEGRAGTPFQHPASCPRPKPHGRLRPRCSQPPLPLTCKLLWPLKSNGFWTARAFLLPTTRMPTTQRVVSDSPCWHPRAPSPWSPPWPVSTAPQFYLMTLSQLCSSGTPFDRVRVLLGPVLARSLLVCRNTLTPEAKRCGQRSPSMLQEVVRASPQRARTRDGVDAFAGRREKYHLPIGFGKTPSENFLALCGK